MTVKVIILQKGKLTSEDFALHIQNALNMGWKIVMGCDYQGTFTEVMLIQPARLSGR